MNRARIIFRDPAWYRRAGSIVSRTPCGGVWFRPDEWPAGEPDLVGRGEQWFAWNEFAEVNVEAVVERAAA